MTTKTSLKKLAHKWYPQTLVLRRALCTAIAVSAAVFVDRYYSILHEFWVGVATVLVLQITVRTNLRQEILRFIVIMAAVFAGSLIMLFLPLSIYLTIFFIFLFITGCFIHNYFPARAHGFSPALMVALIMLLMLVPFSLNGNILFDRLHDVVLGGAIGMIAGLIIFPGRADVDFRIGVIPVLRAYSLYITAITELLFQEENAEHNADMKKVIIEKALQSRQIFFPAWVYEKGFTVSLRAGHRHFLIRVEQMGQVLFAMNYAARYAVAPALLEKFRQPILTCVNDFKSAITDLITVLSKAELTTMNAAFADDLAFLENNFQSEMAMPFELAETSPDYMHMTSFIYGMKNLQEITSKLEESLRAYISHLDYPAAG
jgi:hypothetical protein